MIRWTKIPTCWYITDNRCAIVLVIPTAPNWNQILIANGAASLFVCKEPRNNQLNYARQRSHVIMSYTQTCCCAYESRPAIRLALYGVELAPQCSPWWHLPFSVPAIKLINYDSLGRFYLLITRPLSSSFCDVVGMSDEADALYYVSELSVRVHGFGDAVDVTQCQFAFLLNSTSDDWHVTRNEPDLSTDVCDFANLRRLRVWTDVGRWPMWNSLDVHRVSLVVCFDNVSRLKCYGLKDHMTAIGQTSLNTDASRWILKVQLPVVDPVEDWVFTDVPYVECDVANIVKFHWVFLNDFCRQREREREKTLKSRNLAITGRNHLQAGS